MLLGLFERCSIFFKKVKEEREKDNNKKRKSQKKRPSFEQPLRTGSLNTPKKELFSEKLAFRARFCLGSNSPKRKGNGRSAEPPRAIGRGGGQSQGEAGGQSAGAVRVWHDNQAGSSDEEGEVGGDGAAEGLDEAGAAEGGGAGGLVGVGGGQD